MKRLATALALVALLAGCAATPGTPTHDASADRAAIHALLIAYGATLDARDFDGFGRLFGTDGVYVAGGGMETRGATEAAALMKRIFAANSAGYREPNFHLFFNEVIELRDADHALATSMSLYMVPDEQGKPTPALMARYEDELAREGGQWRFARRVVKGLMSAKPAAR